MQASDWAPETYRCPICRAASTASRSVASNESPYVLRTTGSSTARRSSGTICQPSLSIVMWSSLCCTQTTSTSAARALSTTSAMVPTIRSRSCAWPTTEFCTSMTSKADLVRSSRVVMPPTLDRGYDTFRRRKRRPQLPLLERLDPPRLLLGEHVADPVPVQRDQVTGGEAGQQRPP